MPGRSKTLGPGFMRSGLLFMLVISIIVVIISTTTVAITIAPTRYIIIIIIPGPLSSLSLPDLTLYPCYQELQTAVQKEEVQGELLVAVEK